MVKTLKTLNELKEYFKSRIRTKGSPTAILAGHFPIELDGSLGHGLEGTFGAFPIETMKIGCELVAFGKSQGRNCKLALLVDDHSLMAPRNWYSQTDSDSLNIRKMVEKRFRGGVIPSVYSEILRSYSLSEEDLFPFMNTGRVAQESKYREEYIRKYGHDIGCSGEFRLIAQEIASRGYSELLAMIPLRCQVPTCNAINTLNVQRTVGEQIPNLTAVMTYLPTSSELNSGQLIEEEARAWSGGIPIISY